MPLALVERRGTVEHPRADRPGRVRLELDVARSARELEAAPAVVDGGLTATQPVHEVGKGCVSLAERSSAHPAVRFERCKPLLNCVGQRLQQVLTAVPTGEGAQEERARGDVLVRRARRIGKGRVCSFEVADEVERLPEVALDRELILPRVLGECHGPLEKAQTCPCVVPIDCAAAGGEQPGGRGRGKSGIRRPKLGSVGRRLLEVVAEDLVELDQFRGTLLDPGCEPRVEVGARRLRESIVGGVANQQVAEAKGVVIRERRGTRPHKFLARRDPSDWRSHPGSSGASAATAPRWNTWPSTAPRSSAARSAVGNWSSRAEMSAWMVAGTVTSSGDASTIASICSTKSGLPSAAERMRTRKDGSRVLAEEAVDQLVRLVGRERLEQDRGGIELSAAPVRHALEQLRAGEAEEQDRSLA